MLSDAIATASFDVSLKTRWSGSNGKTRATVQEEKDRPGKLSSLASISGWALYKKKSNMGRRYSSARL